MKCLDVENIVQITCLYWSWRSPWYLCQHSASSQLSATDSTPTYQLEIFIPSFTRAVYLFVSPFQPIFTRQIDQRLFWQSSRGLWYFMKFSMSKSSIFECFVVRPPGVRIRKKSTGQITKLIAEQRAWDTLVSWFDLEPGQFFFLKIISLKSVSLKKSKRWV